MSKLRWQPLEANPEVMTKYAHKIGLSPSWEFVDVYSLDLLAMVPAGSCALILLFPITDKYEKYCLEEKAKIESKPQAVSPNVYFMKQTIGNACGTIGLIHSFGNNRQKDDFIKEGSVLHSFFEATGKLSPEKKGAHLESDEGMCKAHETSAKEGQSREVGADEKVDLHFVAIVKVDDYIYELDGRKPYPIMHEKCVNEDDFLLMASNVCRKFMVRDPDEARFSMIALTRKDPFCIN